VRRVAEEGGRRWLLGHSVAEPEPYLLLLLLLLLSLLFSLLFFALLLLLMMMMMTGRRRKNDGDEKPFLRLRREIHLHLRKLLFKPFN
jgi:hypothetical protein